MVRRMLDIATRSPWVPGYIAGFALLLALVSGAVELAEFVQEPSASATTSPNVKRPPERKPAEQTTPQETPGSPVKIEAEAPVFVGECEERVSEGRSQACIVYAMDRLAQTERTGLARLSRRRPRSAKPLAIAREVEAPSADGFLLLALSWRESRWNARAVGDQGRSCGLTQVRVDFPGRPACADLVQDWRSAVRWAERKLTGFTAPTGLLRLYRYNGSGDGAERYENEVWRANHLLRTSYERCTEGNTNDDANEENL